jgi:hypothetical protein
MLQTFIMLLLPIITFHFTKIYYEYKIQQTIHYFQKYIRQFHYK